MQIEGKRDTRKYKQFNEKHIAKWNKGSGNVTPRPRLAKLPTCAKELIKEKLRAMHGSIYL